MIARGGTAKEAETLATAFQELMSSVLLEERELKKENDIIKARALPTAKPKKPANKPNEFKTNDDFCPGCGLELRSMSKERTALYRRRVRRRPDRRRAARPVPAGQAGSAPLPRMGARTAARSGSPRAHRRAAQGHRVDGEGAAAEVHLCPRRARRERPPRPEGPPARQPDAPGRHRAARVPLGLEPGSNASPSRPAAAGSSWHGPSPPVRWRIRVIVNRVWKGHFGTGLVNTPSNLGVNGERPTHPELLDYLAQSFVDNGSSIKALHREIMRSAVYRLSADHDAARVRQGRRQPPLLARDSPAARRRADSRLGALRVRRARSARRGPVRAADAARHASYRLRPRQPLQARRVPAAVRLPEPEPDRRAALLDHRAAAAPVLHEQRFHAAARRAAGRAGGRRARRCRADRRRCTGCCSAARRRRTRSRLGAPSCRPRRLKQYEDRARAAKEAEKKNGDGESDRRPSQRRPTRRTPSAARTLNRMADGMMAGVTPGAKPPDDEAQKMMPITDLRPLREGPSQLERVPFRELAMAHRPARPSPVAKRCAASATASA